MNGRVFITGDKHGDFSFLPRFCEALNTTRDDVLIILGDAGLNIHSGWTATECGVKRKIGTCDITLLLVRGNHEWRPSDCNFDFIEHDIVKGVNPDDPIIPDKVYCQSGYPNILYAEDGAVYSIYGQSYLAIGGAYSVDKPWRLLMNRFWVPNEQLSQEERMNILDKIWHHSYTHVLTHTCPEIWEPRDLFLTMIDQSTVDKSTERFLEDVTHYIDFEHWWFGHYHDDRMECGGPSAHMLFDSVYQILDDKTTKYVGTYHREEY